MQIGFIGLGNLGLPVAENILQKRQQLLVYNRTASKAQSIIQNGAVLSKSVRELASACDIVFSIVSDDAALNHITKGENGIAENLKAGGIHISMSTILPATATSLTEIHKQHSNYYISSPIMGRPEMARARKLIFLVSGDTLHIEKIKPLLDDAGAASIREFGEETADACVAKLCTNFLIVSAIESLAESS